MSAIISGPSRLPDDDSAKARLVEALHADQCDVAGCRARGEQERAVEAIWPLVRDLIEQAVQAQAREFERQMWSKEVQS